MMTYTYAHSHTLAWLLAQTHTHTPRGAFLFTLTGAFPLHACSVTRDLRIIL